MVYEIVSGACRVVMAVVTLWKQLAVLNLLQRQPQPTHTGLAPIQIEKKMNRKKQRSTNYLLHIIPQIGEIDRQIARQIPGTRLGPQTRAPRDGGLMF